MSRSFEEFLRQCDSIGAVVVLEPLRADNRIGFLALACQVDGLTPENLNLTCEVVGSEIRTIADGLARRPARPFN